MRQRDPRISLLDALTAGEAVEEFLRGKSIEDYAGDRLLSSAVERQLEVVGESLSRVLRADPALESRLPEARDVIGFRNVLAHGYDTVSDALVWSIARERLPELLIRLRALLESLS